MHVYLSLCIPCEVLAGKIVLAVELARVNSGGVIGGCLQVLNIVLYTSCCTIGKLARAFSNRGELKVAASRH